MAAPSPTEVRAAAPDAAEPGVQIEVRETGGRPLAGVEIQPWPCALPTDGAHPVGRTDEHGGAALPVTAIPASKAFALAVPGRPVLVPAGDSALLPHGELPRNAFDPVRGTLTAGAETALDVQLKAPLHRFGIEVVLPDGTVAEHAGIALRGAGLGFGSMFINANGHTFWSPVDAHEFTTFQRGYLPIKSRITRGAGRLAPDGTEWFRVTPATLERR